MSPQSHRVTLVQPQRRPTSTTSLFPGSLKSVVRFYDFALSGMFRTRGHTVCRLRAFALFHAAYLASQWQSCHQGIACQCPRCGRVTVCVAIPLLKGLWAVQFGARMANATADICVQVVGPCSPLLLWAEGPEWSCRVYGSCTFCF